MYYDGDSMSSNGPVYATVGDAQAEADDLRNELISKITQAIMGNTVGVGPMVRLCFDADTVECNKAVKKSLLTCLHSKNGKA